MFSLSSLIKELSQYPTLGGHPVYRYHFNRNKVKVKLPNVTIPVLFASAVHNKIRTKLNIFFLCALPSILPLVFSWNMITSHIYFPAGTKALPFSHFSSHSHPSRFFLIYTIRTILISFQYFIITQDQSKIPFLRRQKWLYKTPTVRNSFCLLFLVLLSVYVIKVIREQQAAAFAHWVG